MRQMGWPNCTPEGVPRLEAEGWLLAAELRYEVLNDPSIARARITAEDRAGRKNRAKKAGHLEDVSYGVPGQPGQPGPSEQNPSAEPKTHGREP